MNDEINYASGAKRRPRLSYSHQHYETPNGKSKIDAEANKEIVKRWKALSTKEKQLFKHMAMKESNELAEDTALQSLKLRKDNTQVRICLRIIFNIVRRLKAEQREAVKAVGLGGTLYLKCTHQYHEISKKLVENFDPEQRCLKIKGQQFIITTRDVNRILGTKDGGNSVEMEGPIEGFAKLCEDLGVENGLIKLSLLRDYLMETNEADEEFKMKFVLYIFGTFLCPTTRTSISQSFVHVVRDVDNLSNSNWAKLTLSCLVEEGIHNCKKKGHLKATGCVLLLLLFYLDHVAPVAGSLDGPRSSTPTLAYWGDEQIRHTIKKIEALGGYEKHEADVSFRMEEEDGQTNKMTFLRPMAKNIGEIKHLLVLLVNIQSGNEYKSPAKRLIRESDTIQKRNSEHTAFNLEKLENSMNETIASSPAAIEKVDFVVETHPI